MPAKLSLATAGFLFLAVSGCGGAEGVEVGATVRAYVVSPLCAEAEAELRRKGNHAGDVRVEAVCLPSVESKGRLDLATVGANARHATEDSTTVAFLEALGPGNEFAEPILEAAEIPWVHSSSGKAAMARLLRAIDDAGGSGSLRTSVSDQLR